MADAKLTAVFSLDDQMSPKLEMLAGNAEALMRDMVGAGQSVDSALDTAESSATKTAKSLGDAADGAERFGKQTEEAGKKTRGLGEESEKAGKKTADALDVISNALISAGIAETLDFIVQGFLLAADASIGFESAITGVYKTVNGSKEQLARLTADIKGMSTVMPASAIEIAGVAESAGQLGIATENITGFSEVMINMGEATNLAAEESASTLAKFSNITDMSADHYENLGSTVVALGNNFATTEADIAAMALRLASAGTLAGLSEAEILALAAAMSSLGIEADAGGSAMSKLLTDMQVAVETESDRLTEFASVAGMTGDEFARAFGDNAMGALQAFISGLNDVERNGATATVILEEMGITEVRLSNAVKSLASDSDGLANAVGVANTAWSENTALANEAGLRYQTLESRLAMANNSATNLAAAFGDDLTPIIGGVVDAGRGMLDWLTGVVENNPGVTAGVTGVAVALGAAAVAMGVYTVATTVATAVTTAFGVASMAALWPLYLVAAAIGGIAAICVAVSNSMSDAEKEYNSLTATSKENYDAMEDLEEEYERVVEAQGENSESARELAAEMEMARIAFEDSKKTYEELVAETDALLSKNDELIQSYRDGIAEIDAQERSTDGLLIKLNELAGQTSLTDGELTQMEAIMGRLAATAPELAEAYDKEANALTMSTQAIRAKIEAQIAENRQEKEIEAYNNSLEEQAKLNRQIAELEAERTATREREGMFYDEYMGVYKDMWGVHEGGWNHWGSNLGEINENLEALYALRDAQEQIAADTEAAWDTMAQAAEDYSRTVEGSVNAGFSGVQGEIDALIAKYDEVSAAAYDSISSQIGLFETMKTETETSVSDMLAALDSQIEYLNRYNENIRLAQELGFDESLVSSLSDGSAESAGQLDAIIQKVQELGGTSEEAKALVGEFNDSFAEVATAKEGFAATVAEMETEFTEKMDAIEAKLAESIGEMNQEVDAAAAAKATMDAYVAAINEGKAAAIAAATATGSGVAAGLGFAETPSKPGRGYASGTLSAEPGLALVGEEGPELVNFRGGEAVYTAPETARILSNGIQTDVPEGLDFGASASENGTSTEKKLKIEIDGKGEIVAKGTDEETIWGFIGPRIKEAVLDLIRDESFEEGDGAYVF